jgi:VPDSG-CTERM motif
MKSNNCGLFAVVLLLGLSSAAQADLEREFTYSLRQDTPEASYREALRHFDGFTTQTFFIGAGRVAGQSSGTITSGDFIVTFNPDKSATITWNLTETDRIFLGVYVAGGPGGGNLYENIPEIEGDELRGTAEVDATRHRNGTLAHISHIDFFCGRDQPVPDEGPTLFLLGGTLLGLVFIRRRFGRGVTGC